MLQQLGLILSYKLQQLGLILSYKLQCLKSSAGNPLAVDKGPGSIAPLWAELWPFKEGNHQFYPKIDAKVPLFVTTFSNAHISGLEWSFAKI